MQGQTHRDDSQALLEAEKAVMSFRQGSNTPDAGCCCTLKDKVDAADRLGAGIGEQWGHILLELQEIAADIGVPADEERERARRQAKDKHLA